MSLNPKTLPIDDVTVDRLYDQIFIVDLGVPRYVGKYLLGMILSLAVHARKTNATAQQFQEGVGFMLNNTIPLDHLTEREIENYQAIQGRLFGLAGRLLNGEAPSSL